MIIQLLEFFFQSFSHWLGGLIYLCASIAALGVGIALIVELLRGDKK